MPFNSSTLEIRLPWSTRRAARNANASEVLATSPLAATSVAAAPITTAPLATDCANVAELPVGASGKITQIHGSNIARLHLMEMGLTPGTTVKIIRVGAFGGPLDVSVRGYRLSIRQQEARAIRIETGEEARA